MEVEKLVLGPVEVLASTPEPVGENKVTCQVGIARVARGQKHARSWVVVTKIESAGEAQAAVKTTKPFAKHSEALYVARKVVDGMRKDGIPVMPTFAGVELCNCEHCKVTAWGVTMLSLARVLSLGGVAALLVAMYFDLGFLRMLANVGIWGSLLLLYAVRKLRIALKEAEASK